MVKKGEQKHILALRFSALGDVAMTVPVLLAVTKKYPEIAITMVSKGFHRPIFEGINNVSFHEARLLDDHKGPFGLWKLYRTTKKLQIDAVADLHNVLRSNVLKLFFDIEGTRVIQIDKGRPEKKALTRPTHKVFEPLKTTHERYADVFAKLGFSIELSKHDVLQRRVLSKEVLQLTIGNDKKKWIGIAPFAAHSGKMYPLERMGKVVHELADTDKYKIFLFGGGNKERTQLEDLASSITNTVSVAGKLTFAQELELISNLDVMVSMDSANGHLAANYGVPVVTIWGVTHPFAGFAPFKQPLSNALLSDRDRYPKIPTSIYGNKMPKGYENVMDTISEGEIISKTEQVLSG